MTDEKSHDQSQSDSLEINDYLASNSNRGSSLASKVSSVLSASYADSDIKDALYLLDKRELKNTPATRRQFRYDIQKEVIERNGVIIQELGLVAEQLKKIGIVIAGLSQACEEIKHHVSEAQKETKPMLEEASALISQRDEVETKHRLLNAIMSHFIISDKDLATLTSTAEPVNDEFFTVFSRAKKIQKDCEFLLGAENQQLGHQIMEQISKNLNGAFQKLYWWIQREFKSLNLENPQLSSSIRQALRALAERPSLFQNCLGIFAETRENILSDSFYTALSGTSVEGDPNPSIKPIELIAHDPLRYIGDMLAWTHSATVSEKEALQVLFKFDGDEITRGVQAGRDIDPYYQVSEDQLEGSNFDGSKALSELVDRNFSGIASVLRQRISQAIHSHEETITAFKIANLLNFYRLTFSKILGDSSILLDSLSTLEDSALKQFKLLMGDYVASLQTESQAVPERLAPPEFLLDGLKQLTAIMKTFETSLTSSINREADFEEILADAFDPFMITCEKIADDLESPNDSIFSINCLLAAKDTLSQFSFTHQKLSTIEVKLGEHAAKIIGHQYAYFQNKSGLQFLFQSLLPLSFSEEDIQKIPTLEQTQPNSLVKAGEALDTFLPTGLMDAIENLNNLQNSDLVRNFTEAAAQKFCEEFEHLEQKLAAADKLQEQKEIGTSKNKFCAIFPRTAEEVKVLLL
ncbi:Conserved oligomeric Golgi complex subunit 6 [Podosphaera aphanis]|nr:Conserved oligomeric Golgi complex subunit 6 [Podosphaera aphanis]